MAVTEIVDVSANDRKALVAVSQTAISPTGSNVVFANDTCTGQKFVRADQIGLGVFGSAVGELTHFSEGSAASNALISHPKCMAPVAQL